MAHSSPPPPIDPLQQASNQQHKILRQIHRVLWVVLPLLALVLAFIIANWSIASTLGTFAMLTIAFVGVGIYRWSLSWVLLGASLYCLIDNYFSYGQLSLTGLRRQLVFSLLFISSIGLFRPLAERNLLLPR